MQNVLHWTINHLTYRRKFRSLTSDNMYIWQAKQRTRVRRKKIQCEKLRRKQIQSCEMYRSVRKAAVARSTFSSQKVQNTISRTTFGSWDVEEWYAAVARSAFSSQNVKNKNWRVSGTFRRWDVQKWDSTCVSQNVQNTCVSDHVLESVRQLDS